MYQPGNQEQNNQRRGRNYGSQQRGGQSRGFGGDRGSQLRNEHSLNVAELAIRGTTMLFDIQMAALRSIWQVQARSAAALGAPDCSELLRQADSGAKQLLTTGAEQLLESARQANDAIAEMQNQFGRIVEQGAQQLTEEIRNGIEELSQRTQQGLQAVKEIAEQTADESARALHDARRAHAGNGQDRNQWRGGEQGESDERGAAASREQVEDGMRGQEKDAGAGEAQGQSRRSRSRGAQRAAPRQQQSGRRGGRSASRHH